MASRDASGCPNGYDQSIPEGVFNVFFPIKTTHLSYKIFLSSDQKTYLSHTGKDSNHTNDVDVSNASCCPTPTVLRPKNIPAVINNPPLTGFSATVAATVGPSSSIDFLMFS